MKIGIVGAGFTGLSAAYFLLKAGHKVTLFEKDSGPGGLALGYQEKRWKWSLEKHYHHWFTNDESVLSLANEIKYKVLIKRPKTSVYVRGNMYQLDSPLTVLNFPLLSLKERLRMGLVIGFLKFNPFWKPLEKMNTKKFLKRTLGKKTYELIWEPQLINKFGKFKENISLAWFWARIKKRTPSLAYPEGGFLKFADALVSEIEKMGGKIYFNAEISELTSEKKPMLKYQKLNNPKFETEDFDKVIVTLPSFFFIKIAPSLSENYKKNLVQLKGLGAINLVMRLKSNFLNDGTYWLSICDTSSPIMAIVDHSNFMDPKNYNDEHIAYFGNYLPMDHKYFEMDKASILKSYDKFIEKISPDYKSKLIGYEVFKAPFAQPIIPPNYSKMIPSFNTPLKNVYLANIQQVYPWDRGTNYAVELGEKIAKLIIND